MELILTLGALVVVLLLGMPIAFALTAAGVLGIWLVTGEWVVAMGILKTVPFGSVSSYLLTTIPMFILMAYFTSTSGIARDLYTATSTWLAPVRGGLAIATVFAAMVFGAMSGASTAAAAAISNIAIPSMRRYGYSEALASGSVAVGATLAVLIPPSIGMVLYALMTETSIGQLLIAGVLPGIILGVLLSITIWVWVSINPSLAPKTFQITWADRWNSLAGVWPSALLILFILALLYFGIATPTEVSAIGALGAGVLAAVMGRLTWAQALEAVHSTIRATAMIFLIVIGSTVFGYFMTLSRAPQLIVQSISDMNLNRWVVIVGVVVVYFVISMFMDENPLLLLTLPLTFPLITSLGFDPIWFGVVSMLMIAMGLVFPPVGMNAFIVSASAKVDLVHVYQGTTVLIIAIIMTLVLVMIFPQIVLWLPSLMRR